MQIIHWGGVRSSLGGGRQVSKSRVTLCLINQGEYETTKIFQRRWDIDSAYFPPEGVKE